jgi:hypothetical protein
MQAEPSSSLLSPRSGVLIAMIAFAVGVRLAIAFAPGVLPYNFTPVEAIALFGGAYFADRRLAVIVPLAAMVVADAVIGFYALAPVIYACIALTAIGGMRLRHRVGAGRVAAYSVASAVFFFLVTNFAVWAFADHVAGGGACTQGLLPCYIAGLPFFQGTLIGTLFWSAALFGGFELLRRRWPALQVAQA